jgi:hypothetical protein
LVLRQAEETSSNTTTVRVRDMTLHKKGKGPEQLE